MRAVVGVDGFTFDAAHYTKGVTGKCMNIHGHTFRLSIEVEGEIDPNTGMVIDFLILKDVVRKVISEYDHKFIIPEKDLERIKIEGPFNYEYKAIKYPEATTEYIALDIAEKIYKEIKLPVRVKLYEGDKNYVVVCYKE